MHAVSRRTHEIRLSAPLQLRASPDTKVPAQFSGVAYCGGLVPSYGCVIDISSTTLRRTHAAAVGARPKRHDRRRRVQLNSGQSDQRWRQAVLRRARRQRAPSLCCAAARCARCRSSRSAPTTTPGRIGPIAVEVVADIDLEHYPNCGGELKIIAAILDAPVIERILTHMGLQARAPPRAPARGQALQAA